MSAPEQTAEIVDIAEKAPAKPWRRVLLQAIEKLNRDYFVADLGGRTAIGAYVRDDTLERERLVFYRAQDFVLKFKNQHYQTGVTQKGLEVWEDLGTAWIAHHSRRSYDRLALLPNQEAPPGVLNLWRGWGVKPEPVPWPTIKGHILDVICAGNQAHFDYLIGWMANAVQSPDRQAEVAVVMRGMKGTGKGSIGQILMRIFGDHAVQIFNGKHLTGHFNAHLADCLFLFVDEAFWAGDHSGEGVLKGLITERSMMVERKGIDASLVPNRLKIIMASNNDWVVPVSADERRYFVLDVGDQRRGDLAYFDRFYAALNGAELGGFLHHLLHLDLSRFRIRAVPNSKGLACQKLIGADSVTQFWFDCLQSGSIPGASIHDWAEAQNPGVVTHVLQACYVAHARDHGERFPDSEFLLGRKLNELWAGCGVRQHRSRKAWTDPAGQEVARPRRYQLGSLEAHRAAFLGAMKIDAADHDWPVVDGCEP